MFRFESPQYFWLLALPVLIIVVHYWRRRLSARDWTKWGSTISNQKAMASQKMKPFGLWLGIVALILCCLAAVNPQWGFKTVPVEHKSADIYLLLDISNSMLAEDIAPSRLERARRFALDLSTTFRTDKVGLILFAGNAYVQSPLTTDWHAIQLYLNAANTDQAGTQGTAIGSAIRLALKASESEEQAQGSGAMIILTDGEDHDSDAVAAVKDATESGWVTYIIGVGTEAGAPIPMNIDGRIDFKRDESGQPVRTVMNKSLMMELAQEGNGKYFDLADGTQIVESLKNELAGLERSQMEKRSFSEHRSYYQWFLLSALMLIFILTGLNYKWDVII